MFYKNCDWWILLDRESIFDPIVERRDLYKKFRPYCGAGDL